MGTKQNRKKPTISVAIDKELFDDIVALGKEEFINQFNSYARIILYRYVDEIRAARGVKTIAGGEPIEQV
jgi:hypothetical protein